MNPIKDIKHHLIHDQKGLSMRFGIVINSRLSSSRIPNKAIRMINGLPMIAHLVRRLQSVKILIIVAIPNEDFFHYTFLSEYQNVILHRSHHNEDPLARMAEVASSYELDYVVRVTHDKIFVDTNLLTNLIDEHYIKGTKPDYLYLNNSIPGTAFEILSTDILQRATRKFKNVEFIGYAAREITKNIKCIQLEAPSRGIRLLVDYPEDLNLMHVILSQLGNDCTLDQVYSYLISNFEIKLINRLPKVTIYTCAHNAEKWLGRTIDSVMMQVGFPLEYILIDDFSSDRTPEIMARAAALYPNTVKFIRNDYNLGLSSSCNIALSQAKGEYIMRIDADDTFTDRNAIHGLIYFAQNKKLEITYPDHFEIYEEEGKQQVSGSLNHHAGGALFLRSALNYVKFTEGLRGHDSLDIFIRSREILKIGYYEKPVFNYYQRPGSLSRQNPEYREKVKNKILGVIE